MRDRFGVAPTYLVNLLENMLPLLQELLERGANANLMSPPNVSAGGACGGIQVVVLLVGVVVVIVVVLMVVVVVMVVGVMVVVVVVVGMVVVVMIVGVVVLTLVGG